MDIIERIVIVNGAGRVSKFGYSSCLIFFLRQLGVNICKGGEWYLEKRGSRKILAGSQNLGNVFDKSRSLVFSWFVFTFFESRNFSPKSLGLGFLTRISASRQVLDFTIRDPYMCNLGISHVNKVFIIIIITTVEMLTTLQSSSEPPFPVTVSCLFAGGGVFKGSFFRGVSLRLLKPDPDKSHSCHHPV